MLWAEGCFRICSTGLLIQTLIAMLASALASSSDGDAKADHQRPSASLILGVLRRVAALVVYVAGFTIFICLFALDTRVDKRGPKPAFSQLQLVVLVLVGMFFLVNFVCFLAGTLDEALEDPEVEAGFEGARPQALTHILAGAKDAVVCCPMLCVLFLGARLRAITDAQTPSLNWHAAPQAWVQDWMYVCMVASILQLVIGCCINRPRRTPLLRSNASLDMPEPTGDYGSMETSESRRPNTSSIKIWAVLKGVCMAAIYVGVGAVVVETCRMTPDTLRYSSKPQ